MAHVFTRAADLVPIPEFPAPRAAGDNQHASDDERIQAYFTKWKTMAVVKAKARFEIASRAYAAALQQADADVQQGDLYFRGTYDVLTIQMDVAIAEREEPYFEREIVLVNGGGPYDGHMFAVDMFVDNVKARGFPVLVDRVGPASEGGNGLSRVVRVGFEPVPAAAPAAAAAVEDADAPADAAGDADAAPAGVQDTDE
jgi:hypothetical protein